jgi:hypothetical protein
MDVSNNVITVAFGAKQPEEKFSGFLHEFTDSKEFLAELDVMEMLANRHARTVLSNCSIDIGQVNKYDYLLLKEAILSMLLTQAGVEHPLHDYAKEISNLILNLEPELK